MVVTTQWLNPNSAAHTSTRPPATSWAPDVSLVTQLCCQGNQPLVVGCSLDASSAHRKRGKGKRPLIQQTRQMPYFCWFSRPLDDSACSCGNRSRIVRVLSQPAAIPACTHTQPRKPTRQKYNIAVFCATIVQSNVYGALHLTCSLV